MRKFVMWMIVCGSEDIGEGEGEVQFFLYLNSEMWFQFILCEIFMLEYLLVL